MEPVRREMDPVQAAEWADAEWLLPKEDQISGVEFVEQELEQAVEQAVEQV